MTRKSAALTTLFFAFGVGMALLFPMPPASLMEDVAVCFQSRPSWVNIVLWTTVGVLLASLGWIALHVAWIIMSAAARKGRNLLARKEPPMSAPIQPPHPLAEQIIKTLDTAKEGKWGKDDKGNATFEVGAIKFLYDSEDHADAKWGIFIGGVELPTKMLPICDWERIEKATECLWERTEEAKNIRIANAALKALRKNEIVMTANSMGGWHSGTIHVIDWKAGGEDPPAAPVKK